MQQCLGDFRLLFFSHLRGLFGQRELGGGLSIRHGLCEHGLCEHGLQRARAAVDMDCMGTNGAGAVEGWRLSPGSSVSRWH